MDVKLEKSPEINISFNSVVMEGGSLPQIQSDWTESNTDSRSYIKNKPTFATINGESITNGGNIEISGSDDSLEAVKLPGVKLGYKQLLSSATKYVGVPINIGTSDFTLEFFGNTYGGSISSTLASIYNASVGSNLYVKYCFAVFTPASGNGLQAIVFDKQADNVAINYTANGENLFHMVVTRSSKNVNVYINGILKTTKEQSEIKDLGNFQLGLANSSFISQVRLFNYALSADEVTTLWNNGNPAGYVLPTSGNLRTGCVAEYLPGNITTSQWIDSAGNNLDLTASGTPQLVNYNIYPTYKQDKLVSGENIKTINGESILGEGDIKINVTTEINEINQDISDIYSQINSLDGQIDTLNTQVSTKQDNLISGTNIKTINGESILGAGNIDAINSDELKTLVKLPGINTSEGYFSSADSALLFEGDRSQEIYFHTPDLSLGITQRIFSDRKFSGSHIQIYIDTDGSLGIWCGGSNIKIQGIESFSPYQVIVVFSETNNNATIYLNGVVKGNVSSFAGLAAPSGYYIGSNGDDLSYLFKGIIYYSRLFNYALSADEVTTLWNNGNPAGYVLPHSFTNVNLSNRYSFMSPMTLDGWQSANGTDIPPVIEDGTIKCAFNETAVTSYKNGIYRVFSPFTKDKKIILRFYAKSSTSNMSCRAGFTANSGVSMYAVQTIQLNVDWQEYVITANNNYTSLLNSIVFYPPYNTAQTGFFYIKDVEVVEVGCVAEYLPGNITTSQWIDSAGNNLDLTASGTPQLVNYNIYPNYKTINGESILGVKDIQVVPFDSPSFTGTPTAPTPSSEDNSTRIATTAFVKDQYASMVNIIPEVADIQSGNLTAFGDKWYYISQENTSGITVILDESYIDSGKQVIIETIGSTPINFVSIESLILIFIQEGVNDLHTQVSSQDIIIYTIVRAGNGFVVNGSIYKAQE